MPKLRIHCFGLSLDGFGAGPNQSLENPLGEGGMALHEWFFPTRVFQKMQGNDVDATGIDNDFAERGFEGIGAWILGRNMFGPVRGAWPDDRACEDALIRFPDEPLATGAAVVAGWIALGWDQALPGMSEGLYEIVPGFVAAWLAIVLVSRLTAPAPASA